jgi:hypothetical protein
VKHYFVVYKSYQRPGLEHFEVDAANKAEARKLFLEANIKHDYIIKIILWTRKWRPLAGKLD